MLGTPFSVDRTVERTEFEMAASKSKKCQLGRSLSDCRGQGLTEYLVLLLLVALLSVAATRSLGRTIRSKIKSARNQIHREVSSRDARSTNTGFWGTTPEETIDEESDSE
jgi:hypothetical protein